MANWQARVAVREPTFTSVSSDPTEAAAEATAIISASLPPGWEVIRAEVEVLYTVGDWVVARKPSGSGEDYARIVLHTNGVDLQVEFADGLRRSLNSVVRRV
jgi:hypothetical protein